MWGTMPVDHSSSFAAQALGNSPRNGTRSPPGTGQPPPILFAPDGGSTPFTAVLVTGAGRRACAAPAAGALTCG